MADILHTIADYARVRVEQDKTRLSEEEAKYFAVNMPARSWFFEDALRSGGMSFICEIKKASPSKGVISEDFPYLDIAAEYEEAGADAVSCLTEPKWFMGSEEIFARVRSRIGLPMLRKDFIIDPYQIYQARLIGANAVLLIASLLDEETIYSYLDICELLGMDALVEAHDEAEIQKAVSAGARIIGVNNRDLKDFSVDFSNAARLRDLIPPDVIYVAESGVKGPEDAASLAAIGADAALVGEYLMRAEDKAAALEGLRAAVR